MSKDNRRKPFAVISAGWRQIGRSFTDCRQFCRFPEG